MATRFAVKTGNWSDTTLWDNGALPATTDDIHANGFTVTLDQDITVASLRNSVSSVAIQNIATPAMTSNTQPSGTVISSNSSGTAYNAFNQDNLGTVFWSSGVNNTGWLGYTFSTGKVIKRYIIKQYSVSANNQPKTWTFEGSNDGFATAGIVLDTVASYTTTGTYTSVLLGNTTAYTSYRINVTATNVLNQSVYISELEMTESTLASPVYGTTTGGSFTVPASLSGTRNIVQSGAGIITNNVNNILTLAHNSGNTVNMNISGGGYIFNPNNQTSFGAFAVSQITGTGTVNFNGDIWGTQTIVHNSTGLIVISNSSTVNVFGNCYGARINNFSYPVFNLTGNGATLNITGNLIGCDTTSGFLSYIVYNNSLATVNITGSLTSNLGYCYYSTTGGNLNIPAGTVTVTNNNSVPAIFMNSTASLLTVNSPIINKSNANAVVAFRMRFYSTGTPYWVFQNNLNADITLAYGSATGSYPNEADVRYGTTYAASPTRTGTLRVPLPQYVSQGVLTDNTVGTAYLSASDVWNVLTSSMTTAGSIGERLKNASTVQTTGDQLASYIV